MKSEPQPRQKRDPGRGSRQASLAALSMTEKALPQNGSSNRAAASLLGTRGCSCQGAAETKTRGGYWPSRYIQVAMVLISTGGTPWDKQD